MSLFFTMLPVYLFGNFHCAGMCGPLVAMIGMHKYRRLYFLGRMISYSMAGLAAGSFGAVVNIVLRKYQVPFAASFLFGSFLLYLGFFTLLGRSLPGEMWFRKKTAGLNRSFSILLLRDQPLSSFLFGFLTVLLPCGQTLLVFSACALEGSPAIGLINGFAFALLTSPSLFFSMHLYKLIPKGSGKYNSIIGLCSLLVGLLAICRGLADLGIIPHFIVNPSSNAEYHIVIF